MADELKTLSGRAVFVCDPEGAVLASEADALDLIGGLWGIEAEWLALPVARLSPDFLTLRTGLAGAVIQKFVNYRTRLALVGDIDGPVAASKALADFVRESNAGDHVWFTPDLAALEARLAKA
jgi:hypothetical protein